MKPLLLVGIGGAAGSILRYLIQRALNDAYFPYGTLAVNLVGCLLVGVFMGLSIKFGLSDNLALLLMTGFCGGFTTLSAFNIESLQLLQQARITTFFLYAASTTVLGLLATFVGYKIAY